MARSRERSNSVTGVALAVVGSIVALNVLGILHPLENFTNWVVRPVADTLRIRDSGKAERQVAELQAEVATLKGQLAEREEAKIQNDALRAQLQFAQSNGYKMAQAYVIGQDPTNFQQVITVNRGSDDGLQKGMVAVSGGLLVGRIIETTGSTAKVYLITDYNSAVPVLDQQTRASGIARGTRGFGLGLEMVQQTDQLRTGDTLITSGFGGDFPPGLVVGTVGEIKRRDTDVFQSAEINPAVDFRKLENIFVITGRQ